MIFHATHNLYLQTIFVPLTLTKPESALLAGEAGVVIAVVTGLVAFYFWLKGRAEKI